MFDKEGNNMGALCGIAFVISLALCCNGCHSSDNELYIEKEKTKQMELQLKIAEKNKSL